MTRKKFLGSLTVGLLATFLLLGKVDRLFAQESTTSGGEAVTAAAAAVPYTCTIPQSTPPKSLEELPARHLYLLVAGFIAIGFSLFSSFSLYISISAYAACKAESKGAAFIPAIAPGTQSLYSSVIAYFMVQRCLVAPVSVALAAFMCCLPQILSAYAQAKAGAACIRALDNKETGLNAGFAAMMVGMCETAAIVTFVMSLLMVRK